MQSSLQEIIAAQKLQAANAHSHMQLLPCSSSPSSSQGGQGQGQGQGQMYASHRSLHTPSSSFFGPGSHFTAPPLPQSHQTSSSSRSKESSQGPGSGEKSTGHTQSLPAGHSSQADTSRSSLEEDQRSDNTVPAGYMVVEETQDDIASNFSDFVLPQPETMRCVTVCKIQRNRT